jgi:hypothetical protein
MICYRDMTFCSAFPTVCKNDKCERAFTESERKAARKWWHNSEGIVPVAFSNFGPGCPHKVLA